jgi:tail lysozyme
VLAAAPQVFHLTGGSPTAMTGDLAGAHLTHPVSHAASQGGPGTANFNSHRLAVTSHRQAKPTPHPSTSQQTSSPSPAKRAKASASPSPTASPTPTGPSCGPSSGMVPANYPAIVSFLMAHGYTGLAAAGVAGNIYQESKGNPESVGTGGGGLIGWTPLPSGFVTGNPTADLHTQLDALLTYNQQWAAYLPELNAATSATDAAYIYMIDFERPGIPATGNREAAAEAVAAACHL